MTNLPVFLNFCKLQKFGWKPVFLLVISFCFWNCQPDAAQRNAPSKITNYSQNYELQESAPVSNVLVEIRANPLPEQRIPVLLSGYYWDNYKTIDTFSILPIGGGVYTFNAPYRRGLYRLQLQGYSRPIDLVINGRDSLVMINLNLSEEELEYTIQTDVENVQLSLMAQLANNFGKSQDSINRAIHQISLIKPDYYSSKNALREKLNYLRQDFYATLNDLSNQESRTYVSQFMINQLSRLTRFDDPDTLAKYETDNAFYHRYFFKKVRVNDPRILTNPIYFQTLQEYLTYYKGEFPEDYLQAANFILNPIIQPEVKDVTAHFLVYYFLNQGDEAIAREIATSFIEGCSDDYIEELKRTDKFRQLLPLFAKAPNFRLPQQVGSSSSFYDLLDQHSFVVLYFWKSTCPYCEKQHKYLKRLYELYQGEGLEILGLSLDTEPESWASAIQYHEMDWINQSELSGLTSAIASLYGVHSTPTIYVIASDGTILGNQFQGNGLLELMETLYRKNNQNQ